MKKNFIISNFLLLIIVSFAANAKQALLPDFTDLVKQTGAAVVNITARQNAKSRGDLDTNNRPVNPFERFFGVPQTPQDRDSVSGGSGFIVSIDGYILTNRHVVHGADEITVTLVDRREYEAELIGEDEASDIAVLKVDAADLPYLKIGDTKQLEIGEWVMAIGSPLSFEHSVTKGIVSAKGRSLGSQQYIPYIQTDVPINRGNSGGPLINMNAEVVGINTLILSNTGGYMGLSFSIPIDVAMSVMDQLKTHGSVKRGLLGVNIQPVTQNMADYLGMDTPKGALVTNVNKDSSAEKAGIQVQDVIVRFNGLDVETSSSLPPLVGSVKPGTKVKIDIIRDGKNKVIRAVLGGLDEGETESASRSEKSDELSMGFEIADISSDQAEEMDLDSGVIVRSISNRDIQRAGLRENDVIIKLGKEPIKNVTQFKKILKKMEKNEPIVLLVKQGGINRFIVIERD